MIAEHLPNISVIEPVGLAVERVKTILFKPFELGKWFTIGFCAWLALLGQSGPHFNFPFKNLRHPGSRLGQVQNVFSEHLLLIIVLGSVGLLIGLAIMITLVWLSSRGRFMFIYCISGNKAEVKTPWHKFRKPANSLVVFKLVAGLVVFVCFALFAIIIGLMIIPLIGNGACPRIAEIVAIVCLSLIMVLLGLASALFFKFTNDFVIPIMYLRGCSCIEAWRQFGQMLSSRKGAFVLYILFQIVIAMAIGMILLALVLGTCCCAACFMAIPYIGIVLMLPVFVFKQAYVLYYLRQFGPAFDIFAVPAAGLL